MTDKHVILISDRFLVKRIVYLIAVVEVLPQVVTKHVPPMSSMEGACSMTDRAHYTVKGRTNNHEFTSYKDSPGQA